MKYFSVFSGVGGFELAMPEYFECVGQSEIDKYALAVLKYRFPNTINYGDITKINWSSVPYFDLLVGGSPCQSFSVAGKRAGLEGASGLFMEFVHCLTEKKPEHFIWENVKGVLSSSKGADFAYILNSFSEAGYFLQWQILNAKDFGVPQNRERIFVIGSRTQPPREVFFERRTNKKDIKQLNQPKHSNDRVYAEGGISPTLNTMQGGNRQPFIARPVITPDRLVKRQNGRRMKENGEPAFTLNAQDRHGVYLGSRIRRLTVTECERLMSWPDDWTRWGIINGEKKKMSDSQRYKMCGNGVVSDVIRHLIIAYI